MATDDIIPLVVLLSVLGLPIGFLSRRFRRSGADVPYALLAAMAAVLGVGLAIAGAFHDLAAVGVELWVGEPYDLRSVWLATIGLVLMYAGLVNAVLSRWIRRAERWALGTAATATSFLFVFLLVLHPAANQTLLILISGTYLGLLLWRLSRRPHRATSPPTSPAPNGVA